MDIAAEKIEAKTELTNYRVVVAERGGPEVLQGIEETMPLPKRGEVRLKVLAAGVSALDEMQRSGSFPGFPKVPFTPGVDIVGQVEAVGAGVAGFETGQRVAALLGDEGGYTQYICLPAAKAVLIPAEVDPVKAVCVVANYLTAYTMLHRAAEVKEGERILVHGAAGGVGSALLELGKLAGLEMYGTASQHNHDFVADLEARPIDYRREDFVVAIDRLTGDGVDAVFDPIGGWRQLWRSYRTLRRGGRLIWFGVADSAEHGLGVIPASLLMRTLLSLLPNGKRAPLPPDSGEPVEWYRQTLARLMELLATGQIDPAVAARFPLDEAKKAHQMLERGGYAGKIVLVPAG